MRQSRTIVVGLCTALVLAACVTINVYFPAAAAQKAADRIIEEVWTKQPGKAGPPGGPPAGQPQEQPAPPQGQPPSQPEGQPRNQSEEKKPQSSTRAVAVGVVNVFIPSAWAAEPNLNVSTPAIQRLTAEMRRRHKALVPYYDSGAVGLTDDGFIAVRNAQAIPLSERGRVQQWVAEQNRDRRALYQDIASANGHPEWEAKIQATFARQWIQRAPRGWWYRQNGQWKQK